MFFILELCYNKHKGNDRNLRPLLAGGWSFFLCDHLYYITWWDYSSQEAKSLSLAKFNSGHKKRARKGSRNSCGADEGSRTLLSSLGSWRSTDELHPHGRNIFCVCIDNTTLFPVFLVFFTISYNENVSHYLPSFTIIFLKIRCDKV